MTDTEETQHTLRPDFYLIVLPHNLKHWNLPEDIDKSESIETVWMFDRNVHIHCCELTPSYKMWPVKMPGEALRHVRILDNGGTDHALSAFTQPCIPGATRAVLAVLPGMRSWPLPVRSTRRVWAAQVFSGTAEYHETSSPCHRTRGVDCHAQREAQDGRVAG
jgi:hypothetical protein